MTPQGHGIGVRARPTLVRQAALLFCLLASLSMWALDPHKHITQYTHDSWQTRDGLPQNTVQAILQTRDGYLWLGTQEGLVRFDGVRFTTFDTRNTPAMKSNFITELLQDREGTLWIGTSAGLLRYRGGAFTNLTTKDGLAGNVVRSLAEDSDGRLWIGTAGGGVQLLDHGKYLVPPVNQRLPDSTVRGLTITRAGDVWIRTLSHGVVRVHGDDIQLLDSRHGLSSDTVSSLCEARDGKVWIGTHNGLDVWAGGKVSRFVVPSLASHFVQVVYQDSNGNIWAGADNGLYRINEAGVEAFVLPAGLTSSEVESLYEDREGNLWVGMLVNGLHRFKDGRFTDYSTQEGLSSNLSRAVLEDHDGHVWIGSGGGGVDEFDGRSFRHYSTRNGLSSNLVFALLEDSGHDLWVGTGQGLDRIRGGRVSVFTKRDGLANDFVRSLAQSRDGELWVGTDAGLSRLGNGVFRTYTTHDGLSNDSILALLASPSGDLWVGTRHGVNRIRDGKVADFPQRSALADDVVEAFYEDDTGSLWIATDANGLKRLSGGGLTTFGPKQGLFDSVLHDILEADGFLWLTSNKGVYWVRRAQLEDFAAGRTDHVDSQLLGEADGMRSRECDTGSPAGWRSHDGRLWFPTVQGIAVLDPRSFGSQLPLPPVIIESAGLDEAVQERTAGRLVVPAHTQKLEFHYAGLSLASPERIRFRYRLQGFDRGWVEAGNRRTAYYTNLPPGDYTFQVVASNGDAMWTPEGATLRVTVLPHFYQTVWFYGLCLAGFWLALWIVGQRYASKLRHREHELRVVKKALEEKHGAEAALRDSEERFRKLAAGTSTETGEAFFRSLVLHASEALGVTYTFVAELKPGAPEVARTLAACKNGEIIPNFEYDLRSTPCENVVGRQLCHYPAQVSQVFPDDHLLAEMGVDAYMGTPLFGASGEALGLFVALNEKPIPNPELAQSILQICAARAATELERIRAEMALRTSEETFSRTFKQSPNTMILATLEEGRCLDINDAGIKLFGAPREEVIGKTGTDLNIWAHPEERARFRRDLAEFGRVADREMLFRSRPGALRTLIINADVIRVKGTPWMLVTARDITDEKTAQEALLASEAKYRDLFENANDVIFTTDPGGRFLSINRAGQALCGLSPAESLQAKMVELLDKPSVEIYAKSMAELLAGRRSATCEVTLCREGAGSRILELALRPIVEEGAVVAIQGIGRDVTERRLLEKKLLQAQKMEAIGTLAGGIAHDFNNLLTVITGYTQLAKDRAGKKGKIGDDLEEIQQATRRATSLTSQLLSFSRSQVAQQSVVNLNDAVNGMWKMLQRLIGEDLKLETKLDPGLASIWADPAQIDQVILNLAANARDAMPSGGTLRFVTAMLRLRVPDSGRNLLAGEYAVLTVTDTGCGMDPATVSRVFEPFFTTKEVGKGTGLGLSTVYAIVQQAGGQISVASSPGRGTTFSLYFPAADREGVSRRKERVEHAARGSETILLVEDDSALRALSTRILHDAGYTVFAASGVEDAACMMQELSTRVDLVITDVVMPDGGGMELVSRVTKTRPGVRVLFMSGYTDGKVPQEYLSGKHPSFLAKPFRPEDLARKVRQVLDSERPLATHPRS